MGGGENMRERKIQKIIRERQRDREKEDSGPKAGDKINNR